MSRAPTQIARGADLDDRGGVLSFTQLTPPASVIYDRSRVSRCFIIFRSIMVAATRQNICLRDCGWIERGGSECRPPLQRRSGHQVQLGCRLYWQISSQQQQRLQLKRSCPISAMVEGLTEPICHFRNQFVCFSSSRVVPSLTSAGCWRDRSQTVVNADRESRAEL